MERNAVEREELRTLFADARDAFEDDDAPMPELALVDVTLSDDTIAALGAIELRYGAEVAIEVAAAVDAFLRFTARQMVVDGVWRV